MNAPVRWSAAEPEVVKVQRLEDGLPNWPMWNEGAYEFVPSPTTVPQSPRKSTMRPSDLGHWTEEGKDTLARILRAVITKNREAK